MFNDYVNYYARFVDYTYKYLNGKINVMIPSTYYIFGEITKPTEFGSALGSRVKINLVNILNYASMKNSSNDEQKIKGLIIGAIAHELSHLDQNIDYTKMDNRDYKTFIEKTNDANALIYIMNHYDQMQRDLNFFDMDLICGIHYTDPSYYYPYYDRVKHGCDKIFMLLKSILNQDIERLMRERDCQNLTISFHDLKGKDYTLTPLKNGIWIPIVDSMRYFTFLMGIKMDINITIDFYTSTKSCIIRFNELPDNTLNRIVNERYKDNVGVIVG